jgi:hypothetical protein
VTHAAGFKWRSSVLKLKPRVRQNSLRRMSLLTNSATNCRTSPSVRRFRTAVLCSRFIPPLQHRSPSLEQVRCSNAYIQSELPKSLQRRLRILTGLSLSASPPVGFSQPLGGKTRPLPALSLARGERGEGSVRFSESAVRRSLPDRRFGWKRLSHPGRQELPANLPRAERILAC